MKIFFYLPEKGNRWIPYIYDALKDYEKVSTMQEADIIFSAWCDDFLAETSKLYPDKIIISYCRRYEIYNEIMMNKINWKAINGLIFVSKHIQDFFNYLPYIPDDAKKIKSYFIPNGVDIDSFQCRKQPLNNKKIALIANIGWYKNHALACQILMKLPEEYKIHTVGLFFDHIYSATISGYIWNLGLSKRILHYDPLSAEDLLFWLMDKDMILSCSISEGNPMNVIESMAMGIKPVIHDWPGARDQFPNVFGTPEDAVQIITNNVNNPSDYRKWVEDRYSIKNYERLKEVVQEIVT